MRKKNLCQHCEKCADNVVNRKTVLGPQAEPFPKAKKITEIFTLFGPGCLQPFDKLLEGWGLWLMGVISMAVSTRARACVSAPHCQHVSRMKHIYAHVLWIEVLLLLVLALYWSKKRNCGRKPSTLCPFWCVSKKLRNSNCFFHADANPAHDKNNRRKCCPFVNAKNGERNNTKKMLQETWEMNYQFLSCSTMEEAVELLSGPIWPFEGLLSGPICFFLYVYVTKHNKIGFQHFKTGTQKFEGLSCGPSWPFFCCTELGPSNNPYLA